jgi:hypothetical protein
MKSSDLDFNGTVNRSHQTDQFVAEIVTAKVRPASMRTTYQRFQPHRFDPCSYASGCIENLGTVFGVAHDLIPKMPGITRAAARMPCRIQYSARAGVEPTNWSNCLGCAVRSDDLAQ